MNTPRPLIHLQRLEAEAIHILRKVVAECDNPVMHYSIVQMLGELGIVEALRA